MNKLREWAPFAFIVAIFMGDVYAGLTVLLAAFLLPLFLFFPVGRNPIRLAAFVLAAMGAPVLGRIIIEGFPSKLDLTVYLPVFYGALALMIGPVMSPKQIRAGVMWGGGATAVTMLVFAAVVPANVYVIPGQAYWKTDLDYASELGLALSEPREHSPISDQTLLPETLSAPHIDAPLDAHESNGSVRIFGGEVSGVDAQLYSWKNRFKNFLGLSNYVSAFLVLGMTVALFTRKYLFAVIFGALVAIMMSRLGSLFGVAALIFWGASRVGVPRWLTYAGFAGSVCAALFIVAFFADAMPTSVQVRAEYWKTGVWAISESPLLGWSRSSLLAATGWTPTWNPHNILLWVTVYTGVFGLVLYLCYLAVSLRELSSAARTSPVFEGALVGIMICLAWSMFEPIAMTPAFELLMATLVLSAHAASRGADEGSQPVEDFALPSGKPQTR